MTLQGSCACGQVTYELRGPLIGPVTYCHCWRCRKHSGSSFGTTAGLLARDLVFTGGQALLSSWESSPGVHRHFAGCCGSPIYKSDDAEPTVLGFRLGTLDADPGVHVEQHYMVEAMAPWVRFDDLAAVRGGDPPFPVRDD